MSEEKPNSESEGVKPTWTPQWAVLDDPMLNRVKENMKNRAGRPTTLSEDIITLAEEYLASHTDTLYMLAPSGKGMTMRLKAQLPSVIRLSIHLNVNRDTIYDWMKGREDDTEELKLLRSKLSDIVKEILLIREEMLVSGSIDGTFTPAAVNFQLAAKHGYIVKTAVEQRSTIAEETPDFWKEISNTPKTDAKEKV